MLFQKHKVFDSFRKLEALYRKHQDDLDIYDEYGEKYTWDDYFAIVYKHSLREAEPVKWVNEIDSLFPGNEPSLYTVRCSDEEAELYLSFSYVEYEETQHKAKHKFWMNEQIYCDIKYWSNPDYLFDWTEGEFA